MWFVFSFLTAFLTSVNDVIRKRASSKTDVYTVAWGMRFFSLFFLLPMVFFVKPPVIKPMFWVALLISGVILTITTLLYNKSIQVSDLSLTTPMLTLSPIFLLMTSPLILGEFPSREGLVGIILIVIGSYILNLREGGKGYWGPFKAMFKERGPRLMLVVALMYSVGANVDKIGVVNSSPFFWVLALNIVSSLLLLPIMFLRTRNVLQKISKEFKYLVGMGFVDALALICQMTALTMSIVPYVITVKRTSALMSSLYGFFILKEKGIRERLVGVALMILGLVVIAVFQ